MPDRLFNRHPPIRTGVKRFGPIRYAYDDGAPGHYRAVTVSLGPFRFDVSFEYSR